MAHHEEIRPGTKLRVRDVSGHWRDKVATSAVEGCYVDGKLKHDFAGVYVRRLNFPDDEGLFWPLDDVVPIAWNDIPLPSP